MICDIPYFSVQVYNISIRGIKVQHGYINSMGYIINNKCGYVPDVNKIYSKDIKYFKNLKYIVIDCLRYKPHPSHFNLTEVLDLLKIINPKKASIYPN